MPVTRRCPYCRPAWLYGLRSRPLRRLVAFLWPPHIIGPDYGPPYSDGLCPAAAARENAKLDRQAKRRNTP